MRGRLIAVVGPSGVGKDSVMSGIARADPTYRRVRRTITRAPGLGGEDYAALTPEAFETARRGGAFCLHWGAHDLHYGIPVQTLEDVRNGADCLANLSRAVLKQANEVFPALTVLNLTASPETLAHRLRDRGRESPPEIARRLARTANPMPAGLTVITLANDGPLDQTVAAALSALDPERV